MQARFIYEVGTRVWLRCYWGVARNGRHEDSCGKSKLHDARIHLLDTPKTSCWDAGGREADYPRDRWPTKCDTCGQAVPFGSPRWFYKSDGVVLEQQLLRKPLFNTNSGDPEPGDLFWQDYLHHEGRCIFWDNCNHQHLFGVLPNDHWWDIDSRASNCTLKDDRNHRCWIRHGQPPRVHVDKNGLSCQAGSGSISVPGWHGFLHNGVWVTA
jgi:hypothetical protein